MNKDVFQRRWKQLRGSAKQKWGKLTAAAILLPAMALTLSCERPDSAITATVKAKMAADTAVPAMRIEVDTKNHVVTLTGNLDTQAQKFPIGRDRPR